MSAWNECCWHDQWMLPPFDLKPLPGEWWEVHGTDDAAGLEREMASELPPDHILAGVSAHAVAVRRHLKEVIFWLPDSSTWARVHLTYHVETDPRWPSSFTARSWDALVEELTSD
jgi:hypothetical protein